MHFCERGEIGVQITTLQEMYYALISLSLGYWVRGNASLTLQ